MSEQACCLDENLTCTICFTIFTDPVTLKCSHSFCQECLQQYWSDPVLTPSECLCPICRKECSSDEPTLSLAFKSLCESIRKKDGLIPHPERLCTLHGEKLKLFCFEDKETICVICYTSRRHKNHACSPIEEAVQDLKKEMEDGISSFHQTLTILDQRKSHLQNMASHIQDQAQSAELQISQEFAKAHQILQEQEQAKLRALYDEKEKKSTVIETKIESLNREITLLQETLDSIKKQVEADDIQLLQVVLSNIVHEYCLGQCHSQHVPLSNRLQCILPGPDDLSDALINMAKHVCSLNHVQLTPTVHSGSQMALDPNTASNRLIISEDLTTITYAEEKQKVPDNSERFHIGVLATNGFTEGRHCWDVYVGENDSWTIGVVKQSINRKKLMKMQPDSGLWSIRYITGKYRVGVKARTELKLAEKPKLIRVLLDYGLGEVTFSNPSAGVTLHTFKDVFTEKLFPYFNTASTLCPLHICSQ